MFPTWMWHCDAVVAGVVYHNSRRVGFCNVANFVLTGTVSCGHQRHPGPAALGCPREPDVGVARLPVLRRGREEDLTFDLSFGRVLPVPAAFGFLRLDRGGDGIDVGDVDEGCVPLLLLRDREVQAEAVDEAERQQTRRDGQIHATVRDEGRCHSAARWFGKGNKPRGFP